MSKNSSEKQDLFETDKEVRKCYVFTLEEWLELDYEMRDLYRRAYYYQGAVEEFVLNLEQDKIDTQRRWATAKEQRNNQRKKET